MQFLSHTFQEIRKSREASESFHSSITQEE